MRDSTLLIDCLNRTLETMFYTSVEEVADPTLVTPHASSTDFHGSLNGRLAIGLDAAAADCLAASFLGLDAEEVADHDRVEVVGELANIVCGSYLSAWHPEGCFSLSAPEPASAASLDQQAWQERICFQLPEGLFRIWLAVEGEKR